MPREPDHADAREPDARYRIAEIAIDLFLARGFDAVTVDEIGKAAGVSRRTMFRLFAGKEEIAFPDHEPRRRRQRELLDAADAGADPLTTLATVSERVLEDFLAHRELVLKRYELTRRDASVREREIVENAGYVRNARRFLRERYAPEPPVPPGAADVVAATVDGVHAAVLRRWVRSGGTTDAVRELRELLAWVLGRLRAAPGAGVAPAAIEPMMLALLPATEDPQAFLERVTALAREQGSP